MIRINLLPTQRAKGPTKKWDVELELAIAIGVFVVTVGICVFYSGMLDDEIDARMLEKQTKEMELNKLKEKVKLVEEFEKRKKLLEDRNRIIEELDKSRSGPVHALDHVSRGLEPLKVWLVRLSMKDSEVTVEGKALTNDDVVEFVNNLRRSDYFEDIRLLETRSVIEGKLDVFSFRLNMRSRS